jgi:HK97 gp10 family phage protein
MLRSRLPQIAVRLDEALGEALEDVAAAIVDGAKARVPVNTGALRDAIHWERTDDESVRVVAGDGKVYYGHMVENGTVNQPPRPFLVPAAEAERHQLPKRVALVIKRRTGGR